MGVQAALDLRQGEPAGDTLAVEALPGRQFRLDQISISASAGSRRKIGRVVPSSTTQSPGGFGWRCRGEGKPQPARHLAGQKYGTLFVR